ncbi:Uncharacterised protein [Segatella copri]|nr:Uncharacterised protein [Segatella copri]
MRQSELLKVCITEKISQHILGKLTGRNPFTHVSPEPSQRRGTHPLLGTFLHLFAQPSEVARHNHLAPHHLFYHFT